ncbi:MAG: hypothetical protein KDD73_01055 [Anaerolineales bacterium]|nr:hypothetical protein [Anaerolineales bacterium]
MSDFRKLLQALADAEVEFILVGGVAATVHGAARLTQDVDVVYARNDTNLKRLEEALSALSPYPRGAPAGLPFHWDSRTISAGLNFILTTKAGDIDLLGEIIGGGTYEALVDHTVGIVLFGDRYKVLSLAKLIEVKRAAGRPKDFEAIAELMVLLDNASDKDQ